jgi:cobalt/nickel transport system permease protein
MFLSRKSRVVGYLDTADNQKMLAAVSGTLLSKSLSMSSEVFLAMQSRGFRGSVVTLRPFHMQSKDWFWASVLVVIAASAIYLGR